MKHFLIIVFIFSGFFANAEWAQGTVILSNGREKPVYIKYFTRADKKKVQFRSAEKGKKTSLKTRTCRRSDLKLKMI